MNHFSRSIIGSTYFDNTNISIVIIIFLVLAFLVFYFRLKKLLMVVFVINVLLAIVFYSNIPDKTYQKDNLVVFSNGDYMEIVNEHEGEFDYYLYSKVDVQRANGSITEIRYPIGHYSYNYFLDFVILSILSVVLYILIFLKEDWINYRDRKRNEALIPFTYITEKEKSEILKEEYYCTNCNSKSKLSLLEESYKKGMQVVHLKCNKCLDEKIVRIN